MVIEEHIEDFLESQEFYELMQVYRHTPVSPQENVVMAFNAVRSAILAEVHHWELEEWGDF